MVFRPGWLVGDTDLTITDPDSTMLTGATIVLTNRQPGDSLNLGADAWTRGMLVVDNARLGDLIAELVALCAPNDRRASTPCH